jgi:ABC-type dipeptide/oligopeptide/nickel transport system permease component
VIIYATFIILFNLLSDLAYAALDPRVRKAYRG